VAATGKLVEPSFKFLMDAALDGARVRLGHALSLDPVAKQGGGVHGALECISLPAKEVIGVGTITFAVVKAPDKGLRVVRGPQGLVVEHGRIPHGFKSDLGHPDRMRGRAGAGSYKCTLASVVHVILVVGAVKVLAVPACWEVMDGHNTGWARFSGEIGSLGGSRHDFLQASISQAWVSS